MRAPTASASRRTKRRACSRCGPGTPKEPLRFVRYNPDCFGVSGQLAEVPQSERHARLLRAVREPPRQDFEVVYLCYDQARPDSPVPLVCEDPGFPEELKPSVRTDTAAGPPP